MANNLAPVIEELRRAYSVLKKEVFDPRLGDLMTWDPDNRTWIHHDEDNRRVHMPMPVINVQARGRKHVDGWYKPESWDSLAAQAINVLGGKTQTIASTDEISIAAEALNRTPDEILTILTHQMVHHCAHHKYKNPQYTQNKNGYHNKAFENLALTVGLEAQPDGARGYAQTAIAPTYAGKALRHTFDAIALDKNVFDMNRKEAPERTFKGSKLKKWSCDCTNIRAAVLVRAMCGKCGQNFQYSDKDKDEEHIKKWLRSNGFIDVP